MISPISVNWFHNYPVKAGLCARSEDWPWSSASACAGHKNDSRSRRIATEGGDAPRLP